MQRGYLFLLFWFVFKDIISICCQKVKYFYFLFYHRQRAGDIMHYNFIRYKKCLYTDKLSFNAKTNLEWFADKRSSLYFLRSFWKILIFSMELENC